MLTVTLTLTQDGDDFPIDCIPLPLPVPEAERLRALDTLPFSVLGDEFKESFYALEKSLAARMARPRAFGGRTVTGPMLAALLKE